MNLIKRISRYAILFAALCLILAGCGRNAEVREEGTKTPAASSKSEQAPFLTFQDQAGKTIVLNKKPERIVVLNTELLQVFDQVGAAMVGRATAPGVPVPESAKAAEEVGLISGVNMEKMMSLKPDLVIGQPVFHTKLAPVMEQAGIPFAILTIKTIDDMRSNAALLGKIAGKADAAAAAVTAMNDKIKRIVDRVPDTKPSYMLLTFMMNTVSVTKSSSIALDIADLLNMRNAASSLESGPMAGSVPFSMEKLVELNPDYLFFVVHGTDEEGQAILKSNLQSNEAWKSLKAVKENKYQFIPSSLFVNNPGLALDQSFEYIAKIVYPEAFGGK